MSLPNDLISQFAKLSTSQNGSSKESTVYGTTINYNGKIYVNIDGSDTITPVVTTSEVKAGERVAVLIKDHTATVIGNITNPAASTESMKGVLDAYDVIVAKVGNFELLITDKISTQQLNAAIAVIEKALIDKASISELEAVKATIKDLDVSNLQAEIARIDKAIINKAEIDELLAAYAEIDLLKSDVAEIETLIGGNLTMDNIQSLVLTSSKVTVDNAFIKDAMIDRVSASKLVAGTINTSLVQLESEDGALSINGSLQQFKDKDGNVRIQIGKDASGDFTFALYGADGKGQLINQNGITASAISDGLIVNDMVAENAAISGEKLDIYSVVEEINGNTNTIKGSKIYLDDKKQTLDVAFDTLSTTTTENKTKIETNTTKLTNMAGQITTLISNTTITTENGETVQLKDQFSAYKQTVDGFTGKISSLESSRDSVNSKITEFQSSINGFSTRVSNTEQKIDNLEVGGNNLLNGTSDEIRNIRWTTGYNTGLHNHVELSSIGVKPGDEIVVSCHVHEVPIDTYLNVWFYGSSNNAYKTNISQSMVKMGESGKLTITVTVPETCGTGSDAPQPTERVRAYLYRLDNTNKDLPVSYSKLQMKKGNIATDWSPSLQDTTTSISNISSQFEQTVNTISASVTQNGKDIAALKLTLEGIELDGFVTFNDLSDAGSQTKIHGGNILTETISGDCIKGGSIKATDEIGFAGGALITGGGLYGASLNFSATSYVFDSATYSYLYGHWQILKDVNGNGTLTVEGATTLEGPTTIDGTSTFNAAATFNHALYAGDNIALSYGSIYAPNGTKNRDYMRLGQILCQSDSAGMLFTNTSGSYIPIVASRAEITGDVVCHDVWASNKVYAANVALTSDRRLKTDIRYVNYEEQGIGDSGLMSPNVKLTTKDMHEFIELIPLASYRMIDEVNSNIDYTYYGFIAQDVLHSKVGSELVEYGEVIVEEVAEDSEGRPLISYKTEERLRYSENKFIAFICGALKEEIAQRKALERRIEELHDIVSQISNM